MKLSAHSNDLIFYLKYGLNIDALNSLFSKQCPFYGVCDIVVFIKTILQAAVTNDKARRGASPHDTMNGQEKYALELSHDLLHLNKRSPARSTQGDAQYGTSQSLETLELW